MDGMNMAPAASNATTNATMSMGGGTGGGCKISMLWNWYTIDACFIASSWRIRSTAAFAGSCIGVVLLVVILEGLRRASKEYDSYITRKRSVLAGHTNIVASTTQRFSDVPKGSTANATESPPSVDELPPRPISFTPTILEQAVRASLHMLQFGLAYFIMLLAMYYNGWFIISILIGAWLGSFIFSYGRMPIGGSSRSNEEPREVTYCCG